MALCGTPQQVAALVHLADLVKRPAPHLRRLFVRACGLSVRPERACVRASSALVEAHTHLAHCAERERKATRTAGACCDAVLAGAVPRFTTACAMRCGAADGTRGSTWPVSVR